jgi:predicted NBD/HSP70 family sugar kinase
MTVDPASEVICLCGRKGCLEALASGRSIGLAARQNAEAARSISTECHVKVDRIDAKIVFEAFQKGNPFAEQICLNAIKWLSMGVANLIHLLDPTHVFIGGGLSLSGEYFWKPLNNEIRKRVLLPNREVEILPAEFKEYATVVGSLAMVLDAILGLEIG